ncbi:MAG TPA: TolC family protein [Bacteroidales bacterium]|nr:TolC family protein [Bacteroidales bacterium]
MKKKRILGAIASLFLTAGIVAGQTSSSEMKLSLKEAQDYAVQNNKTMISSRMDVESSRASIWETISNLLPSISASGALVDNVKLGSTIVDFGGQQVEITFGEKFNTSATFNANLVVFNAPALIGIQTTKLANKLSESSLLKDELETRESVGSAYYNILITEKYLEILEGNIEVLKNMLASTRSMLAAGMAEQTDVDQMASNVNMSENSKSALLRNNEINYNLMRYLLGVSAETKLSLIETLEDITAKIAVDDLLAKEFDLKNNIDYMLVEGQTKMSSLMLKSQKSSTLPTLAAFSEYGVTGMGAKFKDQMWFQSASIGLSLSIPIFASGQRYIQIKKAQIAYDKALNSKEMVSEQLLIQEKQLRYNLASANQQYLSQKDNVEISKRVYTSTENKYKQGMASSLDLTQANSLYLQAENSYIGALMNLMQTKLALDKLLNNM